MEHSQFCEHAVKKKLDGTALALRILIISVCTVVLLFALMLGLVWENPLPTLVVAALVTVPLGILFWRRTIIELEYSMTGGVLVFSRIYAKSARRIVFEKSLGEIKAAFPYGGEYGARRLFGYAPEIEHFALFSKNAEDNKDKEVFCCIFLDDEGKTNAFYFELTNNAYRFLKTYAGNVTAKRERPASHETNP